MTGEGDATAEDLVAAFARWAADQRVEEAAGSRSRERWLRQQAAESATLVGTLVDLAEQRAHVTVVVGARHVAGRLVGVGVDSCVVTEPSGVTTVVSLARLSAVRVAQPRTGSGEATGERSRVGPWTLAGALSALAGERNPVRLGLQGGETLTGRLVAVGEDLATLQLPAGGTRAYVVLTAIETATPL
jgi:hypothetical protein